MSLVTTSNLAKMNKDRFQKKKIEPAVYPPPPQVADGFKNPTLGNSFIQNQEPTIFRHPSIKSNYGFGNILVKDTFGNIQLGGSHLQKMKPAGAVTDTFDNIQLGGSVNQKLFPAGTIKDTFGNIQLGSSHLQKMKPAGAVTDTFGNIQLGSSHLQKMKPAGAVTDNFGNIQFGNSELQKLKPAGAVIDTFKNIKLGSSFKKNHEKTIFQHPSIKNDYGFGTPFPSDKPILDFVVNGVEQHSFVKFVDQKVVSRNSRLQPQLSDQSENPDYKGPTKENLTTWNVNTPIQSISQDFKPEADFTNPSKNQEFLNNYYTQFTRDQIRSFSGDRVDGRGFSEPHIYTDITFYAGDEGANNGAGNTQFLGFTSPTIIGADLQRYASHLQSTRGLTFMTKKFLQQAFNQRAENGLFNPVGILASRNGILRFKSQFDFNLKNLKKEPDDSVYKQIARTPLEFVQSFTGINVTTYQESLNQFITDEGRSFLQAHGYGVRGELPLPLFNQIGAAIANIKDAAKKFADKQKEKLKNKAKNSFDKFKNNPPGKLKKFVNGVEVPDTQAARAKFSGAGKDLTDAVAGNVKVTDDESLPSTKATQKVFVPGVTPAGRDAIPNENDENTISLAKYKALSYGGIEEVRKGISGIPGKAGENGYTAKIKASPKKSVYISYGLYEEKANGKIKGDRINKVPILNGEIDEAGIYDTVNGKDFIPLFINVLNTDETIVLRSMISDLSEDITPNWESIEYLGRPDKQYVYKNTERKISFKVSIIPSNQQEFEVMWQKINKITALNYPSMANTNTGGQRMVAPFVKLTLGDMIKQQSGYFEQVKANPIDNTPFSLVKGQRLPMYMEIEFTFVYIGSKVPELVHEDEIISGRGQFFRKRIILL